jgi:hypothetical protein
VKPFLSVLLAGILTLAVGMTGWSQQREQRINGTAHTCSRIDDRTCRSDHNTDDGMNGAREAAFEAVTRVDLSTSSILTLASIRLIDAAGGPTPRRGALSSVMAAKRPHDPPHLHSFSLLI